MSPDQGPIERFLSVVRGRLNRHLLWTTLVWTVASAAAVVVVLGAWYVSRGYEVPRAAIAIALAVAVVGGVLAAVWRRYAVDSAAHAADRFYRLHDATASYLHFRRAGRSGGYYALQAEQTRARVEPLDPGQIKYQPPRRGIALAVCLVALAVPLGLRGPSEEVLRQQQLADQTRQATAEINEELARLVEQLRDQSPDDEERELLDPDKLRQWVDQLRQMGDHKEALRQYAQLERQLNEARLAMRNRRDEQLLQRAAHELDTSRQTQPLAETLKAKDYDRAAGELQRMSPERADHPLSEQRKALARLKAAAQHMAAAARASRSAANSQSSAAKSSSGKSGSNGSSGSAGSAAGAGGSGGGDMGQTMADLAQAVGNLDKSLDEALRRELQRGQCDAKQLSQCQSCSQRVRDELAKLCSQLKKLGMCQRTDQRLCRLCRACSQCQGLLAGQCSGPNAGGKKAGMGTNTARRDQRDELLDNGQTTQLRGIKGQGQSLTSVESANEGSGVAARRAADRQRDFRRQVESFVVREDVPDEVKDGVKHYFEVIHELPPAPNREETPPHDGHGI